MRRTDASVAYLRELARSTRDAANQFPDLLCEIHVSRPIVGFNRLEYLLRLTSKLVGENTAGWDRIRS